MKEKIITNQPKYIIKEPKFSCGISPYIMWHHNLIYKSCPLIEPQRNMSSCNKCVLNLAKSNNKIKDNNTTIIGKRNKEPIPNIGTTYISK